MENETIYIFEHDMTEKFFAQKYNLLCKYVIYQNNMPQDIDCEWYKILCDIIKEVKSDYFPDSYLKIGRAHV